MSSMASAVRHLLTFIDPDPDREDLADTPKRVEEALIELTSGNGVDPVSVLGPGFASDADEMIVVRDLAFVSLCEHHLMAFNGHATVGYLPQGRILGLSKIARALEVLSHRLQVQERLTMQLAETIHDGIGSLGTGVILTATHSCMSFRGVRNGAETRTSAMLGVMRDEPAARAEFLSLA